MSIKLTSRDEFRRIADTILRTSKADDTVVNFSDSRSSTLRFANNQVVQNVSVYQTSVSIEVAFGQQVGQASTNRLDAESIEQTVRQAERIAKITPADPESLPPLPPQEYLDIRTFYEGTAAASPMDMAHRVKPAIDQCEAKGLYGAGILTLTASAVGVAASSGLSAYEQRTDARFSLTATSREEGGHSESDSSGWTYNAHRDIDALDIERRTSVAVDKALSSRNPTEVEPGFHTVVLEPAAVAGIFGPFFWSTSAKNYYKGTSSLVGKLNTELFDPRLTITSDPRKRDLLGTRFGGNGMASAPITWVKDGVLTNLWYDRFTAKEHNVRPTPPGGGQIMHFNGPQAASIDELIAGTERGILITNFWYIRSVNPTDLTLTGMTRDGTFLIENGRVTSGLKNFRFHESPLRAFKTVAAATAPMESITLERGKMLLPAVRLPKFHLSSVTKF